MTQSHDDRGKNLQQSDRCWCLYIGDRASDNFRLAREQGLWGAAKPWFGAMRKNDRVLFVHHLKSDQQPAPPGYPRVADATDLSGRAKLLVEGELTSDPFESHETVWPDGVYPYRFRFRETNAGNDVEFNRTRRPDSVVDAVRKSAIGGAKPHLAELAAAIHLADTEMPRIPVRTPDLSEVQADFSSKLIDSHVSFGPRHTEIVRAFIAALATKRLVILTGLSGSGKTQIAIRFGDWLGADRSLVVPVRPDWTGAEALFGYEDALQQPSADGRRVWHVPDALAFMLKAAADREQPYLLVLDEMNLAHVERYFADVLSGMESDLACLPNLRRDDDGLWRLARGELPRVGVPRNLFVVGTVNVDETTYLFSPKVLDRANTFEFRVATPDLSLDARKPVECEPAAPELTGAFLAIATDDLWHIDHPAPEAARFAEHLQKLHSLLAEGGFEFGHRVFYEAVRFAAMLAGAGEPDWIGALDLQVMQKVLPRIHGSRRRLEPTICALGRYCFELEFEGGTIAKDPGNRFNPEDPPKTPPRLPISFEKVRRMTSILRAQQFTSFTEQ